MLFYSDSMAREIDSNITNRILSQLQSKYGNFNPSTDVVSFIGAYPTYNPWKKIILTPLVSQCLVFQEEILVELQNMQQ